MRPWNALSGGQWVEKHARKLPSHGCYCRASIWVLIVNTRCQTSMENEIKELFKTYRVPYRVALWESFVLSGERKWTHTRIQKYLLLLLSVSVAVGRCWSPWIKQYEQQFYLFSAFIAEKRFQWPRTVYERCWVAGDFMQIKSIVRGTIPIFSLTQCSIRSTGTRTAQTQKARADSLTSARLRHRRADRFSVSASGRRVPTFALFVFIFINII